MAFPHTSTSTTPVVVGASAPLDGTTRSSTTLLRHVPVQLRACTAVRANVEEVVEELPQQLQRLPLLVVEEEEDLALRRTMLSAVVQVTLVQRRAPRLILANTAASIILNACKSTESVRSSRLGFITGAEGF